MELPGDMGHVESHFGLFGDSVSGLCQCKIGARFARNKLLGDISHVECHFNPFGDSANPDAR
jgi:hypothetical protein